MKKIFALAIIVIMLTAMVPAASAASATVYVSVSVDGVLELAAQPVTVTDLTVDAAIRAAHAEYCSEGESGYIAGIDPTWGMFMITQCWGVTATPYVIINGAPSVDRDDYTVDEAPVRDGDNLIISMSSTGASYPAVSLTLNKDNTLYAQSWGLDGQTFLYTASPLAYHQVVDAETGEVLGETDDFGRFKLTKIPECGVIEIKGLAAIPVGDVKTFATVYNSDNSILTDNSPDTPGEDITVYVTVSLDGVLQIAAKPVTVNIPTVDEAIRAAHAMYYSGGEPGYIGNIDPLWGVFVINTCWGVAGSPYVIKNGAPLGAGENFNYATADEAPVNDGDNIILSVSTLSEYKPVSLTVEEDVITALLWELSFQTFIYESSPLAGHTVVDPETGKVLGKTDDQGRFKITRIPERGVIELKGLAAILVDDETTVYNTDNTILTDNSPSPAVTAADLNDNTVEEGEDTAEKAETNISIPMIAGIAAAVIIIAVIVIITVKSSKKRSK